MQNVTSLIDRLPQFVLDEYDKQIMELLVEQGYNKIEVDNVKQIEELKKEMKKNKDVIVTKLVKMKDNNLVLYCEFYRKKVLNGRTKGIKCIVNQDNNK